MQAALGPMLSNTGYATTVSGHALRNPWENQDPGTHPPPPAQRDVQVTWRCSTFYLTRAVHGYLLFSRS